MRKHRLEPKRATHGMRQGKQSAVSAACGRYQKCAADASLAAAADRPSRGRTGNRRNQTDLFLTGGNSCNIPPRFPRQDAALLSTSLIFASSDFPCVSSFDGFQKERRDRFALDSLFVCQSKRRADAFVHQVFRHRVFRRNGIGDNQPAVQTAGEFRLHAAGDLQRGIHARVYGETASSAIKRGQLVRFGSRARARLSFPDIPASARYRGWISGPRKPRRRRSAKAPQDPRKCPWWSPRRGARRRCRRSQTL